MKIRNRQPDESRRWLSFWNHVDVTESCWLYHGKLDRQGYGRVRWYENHQEKSQQAHRWLYLKLVGDFSQPALDHLCRVHNCVNPDHLEPVSVAENNRRSPFNIPKLTCDNCGRLRKRYSDGKIRCGHCKYLRRKSAIER